MMPMQAYLNHNIYGLTPSAIREFTALAHRTEGCISLTLGEPDCVTSHEICNGVTEALQRGETHYIFSQGTARLRAAISEHERERHGLVYAPDDIIVTAGATEALYIALHGILNVGDEVIVPTPAFVLYEQIIRLCGGIPVPLNTEKSGFQLDALALEKLVTDRTKTVILNSPNNPTGIVYSAESLEGVRRAIGDKPIFLLCDEVYRDLCDTDTYCSAAEFEELRERLLVVQSFSKSYAMTGWRLGYLMCDTSVRPYFSLLHQYCVASVPAPFQRAAEYALYTDTEPLRRRYAKRREYVFSRLSQMGIPAARPQGGFFVFPDISEFGMRSVTFCTRMISEAGVAATPGICFGSDRHIRFSVSASEADLKEGMDRVERFAADLRSGRIHA